MAFVRGMVLTLIGCLSCGNPPKVKPNVALPAPPAPPGTPTNIQVSRPSSTGTTKPEPLIDIMSTELARSMSELSKRDNPPYFGAYTVIDERKMYVSASFGAVDHSSDVRTRKLDVAFRIGSYARDNTHAFAKHSILYLLAHTTDLPLENDEYATRSAIWLQTDQAYKKARQALQFDTLPVGTDPPPDDFSPGNKTEYFEPPAQTIIDRPAWERRLRDLSVAFKQNPDLHMASVALLFEDETRYYTNSEGTRLQVSQPHATLTIRMIGLMSEAFTASSPALLPTDDQIRARIAALAAESSTFAKAPALSDYDGPIILEGDAAGLFFYEAFGQAIEYRRDQPESLAFAKRIGSRVMPEFLDVYDDPTIDKLNGRELAGFYRYDHEGVRGERVSLVERGVLKAVLTSRSPMRGQRSNGHGRSDRGLATAHQSNLVVAATRTVDRAALRRMLLDEVKKQGKSYGLVARRIFGVPVNGYDPLDSSFHMTTFAMVRVHLDGREELVHGGGIQGERLKLLSEIVAASTDVDTFNWSSPGFSATSPSVLMRQVKVVGSPVPRFAKGPSLPPPPIGGQP